jgi:hypothetical protein
MPKCAFSHQLKPMRQQNLNLLENQAGQINPNRSNKLPSSVQDAFKSLLTISVTAASWYAFDRLVLKELTNSPKNYIVPLAIFYVANRVFSVVEKSSFFKKAVFKAIMTFEDIATKVDDVFSNIISKALPIRSFRLLQLNQTPSYELTNLEIIRVEVIGATVCHLMTLAKTFFGMKICDKVTCHLPIRTFSKNSSNLKLLVPYYLSSQVGLYYHVLLGLSTRSYKLSSGGFVFGILIGTLSKISKKRTRNAQYQDWFQQGNQQEAIILKEFSSIELD